MRSAVFSGFFPHERASCEIEDHAVEGKADGGEHRDGGESTCSIEVVGIGREHEADAFVASEEFRNDNADDGMGQSELGSRDNPDQGRRQSDAEGDIPPRPTGDQYLVDQRLGWLSRQAEFRVATTAEKR